MKKRILGGRSTLAKLEESIYGKLGVQEELDEVMEDALMGFAGGKGAPPMLPPGAKKQKQIEGFNSRDK